MGVLKMDVPGGQTGGPVEGPIPRRHPCSRELSRLLGRQPDRAVRKGPRDRQLRQGLRLRHDLSRKSSGRSSSGRLHRLSVRRWLQGRNRSSSGPLRRLRDLRWRRVHSRSSSGRRHHRHDPRWRQGLRWPHARPHRRRARLLHRGQHRWRDRRQSRPADVQQRQCPARFGGANVPPDLAGLGP